MVNATTGIKMDKTHQLKSGVDWCNSGGPQLLIEEANKIRKDHEQIHLVCHLYFFNCPPWTHWKVFAPQIQVLDLAHSLWPWDSWVRLWPPSLLHAVYPLPQWAP